MSEALRRLMKPKEIPHDEWTKEERERGAPYPEYILPLRARIKTLEQQKLYLELLKEADKLEKLLFEAYPTPSILQEDHMIEVMFAMKPRFFDLALRSRPLADSHRGFQVGCVAVGFRTVGAGDNPWKVLFDVNTRQETDYDGVARNQKGAVELLGHSDIRKHCAELHVYDRIDPKLREMGLPDEKLDKAVAIYVAGEPKVDDDSKKSQVAICSCKLCRDRSWKMSQRRNGREPVLSPRTPVFTVNPLNPILNKMMSVRALHEWHDEVPPEYGETD